MRAEQGRRYSGVAMLFHWVIAALVIMNWQIVERAGDLDGALRGTVMGYHKAWGIVILTLSLGRLAWRLTHRPPPFASTLKPWERALAKTVHTLFYVLLIGLPLGGWIANSYIGKPIDFFGLFTIPALPTGTNPDLGGSIFDLHETGGKILLLLIVLHVAGALKHTLIDRDGTLWRMLPFGTPRG
ncbi:cytochrome b [Altererythrobacter aerius]|uniref:Cytochrome b n=1 Tax=Tsuneonella aeria TaxID=1837929 RepID=A0A6I4TDP1_9SPHN|nr:cytochrome b [Tsuneonella aeria]MXO74736.1 cytochrome b [Tsuneonella aeria]